MRSVNSRSLRFEAAGRQLDVLVQQRVLDVGDRELARGQVLARQPHAHGVAARAVHAHVGHAVERRELVDQITLHVVGELEHVALRARDVQNSTMGSAPLSTLVICGGSASSGSRPRHARQALAHVVGGGVEVAIERELDVDLRALVAARRIEAFDAFDARDLVLDDLRDARLDHVGRRAAIARLDVDHRLVDVGVLAQATGAVTAPTPRMSSSSDITVAKTGRRTDRSEIIIEAMRARTWRWPRATGRLLPAARRTARSVRARSRRRAASACLRRPRVRRPRGPR